MIARGTGTPSAFILPSGWVSRIGTADSLDVLQHAATDLAAGIGFGNLTYSLFDMPFGGGLDAMPSAFFTRYPTAWVERYVECDYGAIDPVVRVARLGRPFCWSDIPQTAMDHAQRHFLNEARAFGIHDGFCVPALSSRITGLINATPLGEEDEARSILRYGAESLTALGLVIHERAAVLIRRETRETLEALAPREHELLRRLTAGAAPEMAAAAMRLTLAETGHIIQRLFRRLDVWTLPHLRARGAQLGLAPLHDG